MIGGDHDRSRLYIAPTVLRDVAPDSPIMQEEIFGPILPVLAVDGIEEAIDFVNRRDKPLVLYVFSESRETAAQVADRTSAGGMCVNETLFHFVVPGLPFGGVGESGMGKYHGKWGFDVFTNPKAVLDRGTRLDPDLRYPPYGARDRKIMRLGVAGFKESIRSRFRR